MCVEMNRKKNSIEKQNQLDKLTKNKKQQTYEENEYETFYVEK